MSWSANIPSPFQFTHPRGVRSNFATACVCSEVSIHAPARGAIFFPGVKAASIGFQFTHPRGVRYVRTILKSTSKCFNSRTREGCDDAANGIYSAILVSIHAPARGAIIDNARSRRINGFNSRTREGCDLRDDRRTARRSVSIHAPARGAIGAVTEEKLDAVFQFTHPRGVRYRTLQAVFPFIKFQFTHPRGVRF